MFRLMLKELAAKKLRLVTTAVAVMLGVAFMAGTLVFSATLGAAFDGLLDDAYAGTDAVVRASSPLDADLDSGANRIDTAIIDAVSQVDGVAAAEGHVSGYAQIIQPNGEPLGNPGEGAPTLGHAWLVNEQLNPYSLVEGRAPTAHGQIVIDRQSANDSGLGIGDTATVLTKHGPDQFTITGIARFADADSAGGSTAVLFTPEDAQAYVAEPGRVDTILVVADDGVSEQELVGRLQSILPDDVEALTGTELADESKQQIAENLSFIDTFLMVFAGIALFVGGFIIFNTFTIIIAQRQRETALLRAIGASRKQVIRSVVLESLAVGVIASAAGVAAGIGIAKGLAALLDAVGLELPAGPLVIGSNTVIISMAVGTLITVLAAYLPARRAGKVPPVAAMRDVALDRSGGSRRRLVIGTGITSLGVASLLVGLAAEALALVGLGAIVTFLGVAVIAPMLSKPAATLIGWPAARVTRISGSLARNNAVRNPRRTASTAAALMIGVGLVGFIATFAASTKASINAGVDREYDGDFVLDTGSFGFGGVDHAVAEELAGDPRFDTVTSFRVSTSRLDGQSGKLFSWDADTVGSMFDLGAVEGDVTSLDDHDIAVSRDYATEHRYTIGSTIPAAFAAGEVTLTVAAIYENMTWVGETFIDHSVLDGLGADALDSAIYLTVAATTPTADARAALDAVTADYPTLELMDRDELKADRAGEIDMILNLIYALLGLAIVIALMGITNTLALSIFERTRELGLLRAVGMTRRQLKSTVRLEAVIIALFGTTLGLAIGGFFGWSIVRALASEGIDQLVIPVPTLAVVTVIAALSGVAASVLPARRAARLDVLGAISHG